MVFEVLEGIGRSSGEPADVRRYKRSLFDALEEPFGYLLREPNLPLIATLLHPATSHVIESSELIDKCIAELVVWHSDWPLDRPTPLSNNNNDAQPSKKRIINIQRPATQIENELKQVLFRENVCKKSISLIIQKKKFFFRLCRTFAITCRRKRNTIDFGYRSSQRCNQVASTIRLYSGLNR
jgi:hypothetical protein